MNRGFAVLLLGLSLVSPACTATRVYSDRPAPYGPVHAAYEEGFRHGLIDGRWAGHRDRGRPDRISLWDDARYRRGSEGYRPWFGSRFEYADGYRAGYEHGYFERRGRGHERFRY